MRISRLLSVAVAFLTVASAYANVMTECVYDLDGDGRQEMLCADGIYKFDEQGNKVLWQKLPTTGTWMGLMNVNNEEMPAFVYGFSNSSTDYWYGLYRAHLGGGSITVDSEPFLKTMVPLTEMDIDNDGTPDLKELSYGNNIRDKYYTFDNAGNLVDGRIALVPQKEYSNNHDIVVIKPVIPGMDDMYNRDIPWSLNKNPFAIFKGDDFNGDGIPDLYEPDYAQIYYGTEEGLKVFADCEISFVARDFNNDGLMDFIVNNSTAKEVSLTVGTKEGTPQFKTIFSGYEIRSLPRVYDFDHDGDFDILLVFCNSGGLYLILLENLGNLEFKQHETFVPDCNSFILGDIDNDGWFEVCAGAHYTSGKDKEPYVSVKINGTTFSEPSEPFALEWMSYDTYEKIPVVADLNGDGKPWIISPGGGNAVKLSDKVNTPPTTPAAPKLDFNAENNLLNISWLPSTDAEHAAADITYEVRIGTTPGSGDVLKAYAHPDGRRRNIEDGREGRRTNRTINVAGWKAGKYYISVQAIDVNHMGSRFSEETVFEKALPAIGFAIGGEEILSVGETAVVNMTVPRAGGINYDWDFDGADIVSVNPEETSYSIVFKTGGMKEIKLTASDGNGKSVSTTRTLHVSPSNLVRSTRDDINVSSVIDLDEDGIAEIVSAGTLYQGDADGRYSKINKLWNNDNKEAFKVFDVNRDGAEDLYYYDSGSLTLLLNEGDKMMKRSQSELPSGYPLTNVTTTLAFDADNDGRFDAPCNGGYYGTGIYNNFVYQFVDLNNDGLMDYCGSGRWLLGYKDYSSEVHTLMNNGKGGYVSATTPVFKSKYDYSVIAFDDFDHDGKYDAVVRSKTDLGNNNYKFEVFIEWSDGTLNPLPGLDTEYYDVSMFDFDNNGFLDVALIAGNLNSGTEYMLHFYPGRKYDFTRKRYEDKASRLITHLSPFVRSDGVMMLSQYYELHNENQAPKAPENLSAEQRRNGVMLSWNHSEDAETPAAKMRYNISVKKKGATGEGAYIISPGNSDKNGVRPSPSRIYMPGNRYFINANTLPEGEYEVRVQGLDLWNEPSDFSEVYELTVVDYASIEDNTIKPTAMVSFPDDRHKFRVGETIKLEYSVEPAETIIFKEEWNSTNTSVVSIDNDGNLTALAEGHAEIYLTLNDEIETPGYAVEVFDDRVARVVIIFPEGDTNIKIGESVQLDYKVYPANGIVQSVKWSSSNPEVASVTEDGVLTGLKHGWSDITLVVNDEISATEQVFVNTASVYLEIIGMTLSGKEMDAGEGGRYNPGVLLRENPQISVTVKNISDRFKGNISFKICDLDENEVYRIESTYLEIESEEVRELTFSLNPESFEDKKPYQVILYIPEADMSFYGCWFVLQTADENQPKIRLTSMRLGDGTEIVAYPNEAPVMYPDKQRLIVTLANEGSDYDGRCQIRFRFSDFNGGYVVTYSSWQPLVLKGGETTELTFDGPWDLRPEAVIDVDVIDADDETVRFNGDGYFLILRREANVKDIYTDGIWEEVEYYDLHGNPVANPTPGIYIEKRNNQTRKVIIESGLHD